MAASGIYSKHPSGISSTIWKSSDLLSDTEVKGLKDLYFSEVTSNSKAGQINQQLKVDDDVAASTKLEPKSRLKPKKRANDDPFASDDDADEAEENRRKEELQSMKTATTSKRQVDDDEVETKPKNKKSKKV